MGEPCLLKSATVVNQPQSLAFSVSIAQARQLPLQLNEIGVFGLGPHRFQSLKRDNCLSNLEHFPLFQLLTGVSIAQARQLPLQPSCSPTSCTWHAGVS